jgi:hypothetical protein
MSCVTTGALTITTTTSGTDTARTASIILSDPQMSPNGTAPLTSTGVAVAVGMATTPATTTITTAIGGHRQSLWTSPPPDTIMLKVDFPFLFPTLVVCWYGSEISSSCFQVPVPAGNRGTIISTSRRASFEMRSPVTPHTPAFASTPLTPSLSDTESRVDLLQVFKSFFLLLCLFALLSLHKVTSLLVSLSLLSYTGENSMC